MELLYFIIGLAVFYFLGHFCYVQFEKTWKKRTPYEKFVTITGIISIVLLIIAA